MDLFYTFLSLYLPFFSSLYTFLFSFVYPFFSFISPQGRGATPDGLLTLPRRPKSFSAIRAGREFHGPKYGRKMPVNAFYVLKCKPTLPLEYLALLPLFGNQQGPFLPIDVNTASDTHPALPANGSLLNILLVIFSFLGMLNSYLWGVVAMKG